MCFPCLRTKGRMSLPIWLNIGLVGPLERYMLTIRRSTRNKHKLMVNKEATMWVFYFWKLPFDMNWVFHDFDWDQKVVLLVLWHWFDEKVFTIFELTQHISITSKWLFTLTHNFLALFNIDINSFWINWYLINFKKKSS